MIMEFNENKTYSSIFEQLRRPDDGVFRGDGARGCVESRR